MSSRYHRLLIYDVKRTTEIDSMGPFKEQSGMISHRVYGCYNTHWIMKLFYTSTL